METDYVYKYNECYFHRISYIKVKNNITMSLMEWI